MHRKILESAVVVTSDMPGQENRAVVQTTRHSCASRAVGIPIEESREAVLVASERKKRKLPQIGVVRLV